MPDSKKFYVSISVKYLESAMIDAVDAEDALEKFKKLVTEGESHLEFQGWLSNADVMEVRAYN